MKLSLRKCLIVSMAFFCYSSISAQTSTGADTTKRGADAMKAPVSTKPKTYAEVITNKAITDKGLFKVHKVADKYYYEIPDSLLK